MMCDDKFDKLAARPEWIRYLSQQLLQTSAHLTLSALFLSPVSDNEYYSPVQS
jgi:hypothetical protein